MSYTIVMPTPEPAKTKEATPAYTRPTPTTTAGASISTYNRPTPTTTVTHKSDSVASASTSQEVRSDGRIDAPKGKNAEAVSDTTVQARSRVRR